MKITEENLEFPCELKEKILKMINTSRIKVDFIVGKNIRFEKTNLAITKPSLIVFSNNVYFIKIFNYGNCDLFVENHNNPISFSALIKLVNKSL